MPFGNPNKSVVRLESQHDVSFPPEAVWPILSRTDWLNRSLGLPPVMYDIKPRDEGGTTITARTRVLGQELRWRELPFEWFESEFYHVRRIFETGPFAELVVGMDLKPLPDGGTRVLVHTDIIPRNVLGKFVAKRLLGPKTKRDMQGVMAHLEEFLHGRVAVMYPKLAVQPVNQSALESGLKHLRAINLSTELLQIFEPWLRDSPDVELTHIRPFAVARIWRRDPWEVFRLFLHATRAGLLNLSWEILCPNCRTSREPMVNSLDQLKRESHCEVCDIKFDADFNKSVELKFTVNRAVRLIEEQTFCLAGPGGKPHVVGQLWLEPGETRWWRFPSLNRPLRLHSSQVKETLVLGPEHAPPSGQNLAISCNPSGFVATRVPLSAPGATVQAVNPNAFPVLLSIEEAQWSDEILTASRATNWQEFRDLFANEIISPTEQVSVGSLVVLFTDLRGSTALYQEVGDARAYVLVRNHFSILTEVIREQHGAVVKTIGDAVMATFSRVDEALQAARQIHQRLATEQPVSGMGLVLKSSLHHGPCLAVNANGRLDYFGTTVNLAARLVECCEGGDICFSANLFSHSEMTKFLGECAHKPESMEMRFRGFADPHRVWRVRIV